MVKRQVKNGNAEAPADPALQFLQTVWQLEHALEEVAGILLGQPDLLDEPIDDICARESILGHPASP